jgi:hypothetical protein
LRGQSVTFNNGSMTMVTGASKMIDFSTVKFSASSEIYTIYTGTSSKESMTGLPIIHVQFATSLPYRISHLVMRSSLSEAIVREVLFNSTAHRGFAISVPSTGSYTFTGTSDEAFWCRLLVLNDATTFAASTKADTFYDGVRITEDEVVCPPTRTPLATHTPLVTATARATESSSPKLTTTMTTAFTVAPPLARRNGLPKSYFFTSYIFTFRLL